MVPAHFKYHLFTLLLAVLALTVSAQEDHEFHQQVSSDNWEIIAELEYQVVDEYEYYPIFTRGIKNLEGKEVELNGYMVPIREGIYHRHFLISVLPVDQCYFCGTDGIPIMVEVFTNKEIRYTDKVIRVKGTLGLQEKNIALHFPIFLESAKRTD